MAKDPSCRKLKHLKLKKVAAGIVHGHGGQFQKTDSMMVISMRSLHYDGNVAHSHLLLAAIPKKCVNKSRDESLDTMKCLWKVLAWSFSALFHCKHPDKDHETKAFEKNSWRHKVATKGLHGDWKGALFCNLR